MVLGVGSFALSRKGAIVKRLRAAETLGNVTAIATDKTGTITENKMRLEHFYFDSKIRASPEFKENEKAALRTALLASDALPNSSTVLGNPMAQAILQRLKQDGVDAQSIAQGWVLKDELSFDVKRKMASYVYQYGSSQVVLSSGAPERILAKSTKILVGGEEAPLDDSLRSEVNRVMAQMAQSGERLLGFGYRRLPADSAVDKENPEISVIFVGILGFIDPPRPEVREAISDLPSSRHQSSNDYG